MPYDYTNVSVDSVATETDDALSKADALIDRATASVGAPSLETTLVPIEQANAIVSIGYGRGAFLAQVSTDPAVRDAGTEAEERITKWRVGLAFRDDLYAAVRALAESPAGAALQGEDRRLLDFWLRDFRRAGQELAPERRRELEGLRQRLVELEVAYQRNISEFADGIEVTREELSGMPDSYIERLQPGAKDGTLRVSLDYPEFTPFRARGDRRDLRETLFRKNWNKAAEENRPLLTEALELRRRIAELLGYPTWAHIATEVRMSGDPDRVSALYDELIPPIRAAAAAEVEKLGGMMAADGQAGRIQTWDWAYYDTAEQLASYGIDQSEVAEYLPLETVWRGLFEITGEVFGLEYREVADARAWHPDVKLYEVRDRSSGEHLASFYADLFPREGKFSHAAAFPLVLGHRKPDGSYAKPVNAIVANFTPPSGDRPSLLRHGPRGEVETLFHEFGHILHMSLTRAAYARFSGADTEYDFVEAPSQIMEHWAWAPELIRRISGHWQTGEAMPDRLIEGLIAARYINVGTRYARQVFFGTLDLAIHGADSLELTDAMRDAYRVTALDYPEDTFFLAGFGHVMGGYDAGYYGYLWAEVIGDDMFGRFATEGLLSTDVGTAYRREVLEPNGTRDAEAMVRAFLGREPSTRAFLEMRGMPTG